MQQKAPGVFLLGHEAADKCRRKRGHRRQKQRIGRDLALLRIHAELHQQVEQHEQDHLRARRHAGDAQEHVPGELAGCKAVQRLRETDLRGIFDMAEPVVAECIE